jgi:hypothetical protein
VLGEKRSVRLADHSPPSSGEEVRKEWSYTSSTPYVLFAVTALIMETASISEKQASFHEATWRYNPEGNDFNDVTLYQLLFRRCYGG